MDTVNDGAPAAHRIAGAPPPRPGQSGEGSRTALEQLQQQEKAREAQWPREAGPRTECPAPPGP